MSRTPWAWVRVLCGAAILAVLVWRVGAGPFVRAVPSIDAWSLTAVFGISVVTTGCCAWRWSLVARGLGVGLPLPTAVAACYRSQFLNTTLPGGVVGDVHRAWRHGQDAGDLSRGVRAVAWERLAGHVVLTSQAVVVLLLLPSPVQSSMPLVAASIAALAVAAVAAVAIGRSLGPLGPVLWGRLARAAAGDLRDGLLARRAWPGILVASAVAVVGHALTFLIAARIAGSEASPARLLPLAVLVILAMGLPTIVAGWGPREGIAAWAFGAAGLGAAQGVATAVVYGVMSFVASLPGAVVLLVAWWLRRHSRDRRPVSAGAWQRADSMEGPVHV
jgi:uncharacterized membrane protein YbhN (UPF0104 family)